MDSFCTERVGPREYWSDGGVNPKQSDQDDWCMCNSARHDLPASFNPKNIFFKKPLLLSWQIRSLLDLVVSLPVKSVLSTSISQLAVHWYLP